MTITMNKPASPPPTQTAGPPPTPSMIPGLVIAGLVAVVVAGVASVWLGPVRHTEPVAASFQAPGTLRVHTTSAEITVVGADVPSVEVGGQVSWLGDREIPAPILDGNTLRLDGCPDETFSLGLGDRCVARYQVRVPAGQTVQIELSSGNLTLSGDLGAVSSTATSGNIDTRGLRTETLTVSANSGNIQVGSGIDAVTAKVSSGNISGSGLTASRLDARASSGNVAVSFRTRPQAITAEVTSGYVSVALPAGGYEIDAAAEVGNVLVDPALVERGSQHTVTARAVSGDIAIRGA